MSLCLILLSACTGELPTDATDLSKDELRSAHCEVVPDSPVVDQAFSVEVSNLRPNKNLRVLVESASGDESFEARADWSGNYSLDTSVADPGPASATIFAPTRRGERVIGRCSFYVSASDSCADGLCVDSGPVSEPDAGVDGMVSEPDAMVSEPDAMVSEPDAIVSEPDAMVSEPDAMVSEPDAQIPTGFAGPNNTGYRNAYCPNGRTQWDGRALVNGATYSCIDFPGGLQIGSSGTPAVGITFYGCRFYGRSVEGKLVGIKGDDITFDHCSFEPRVAAPPVSYAESYQYGISADGSYGDYVEELTVQYCDFWGFGNAIDVDGSTQAKPQRFIGNWIHDAADDGGSYHTDGIGCLSGNCRSSYVVLDGNTIESVGNTNGVAFQAGTYDHFTVTNNLFGGFGFTVAILNKATNVTFTDNTFSTRLPVTYGPLYTTFGAGSTWKRNRWHVPSGAAWGLPEHDGWYWLPNGGDRHGGQDDSQFVSQTDYQP